MATPPGREISRALIAALDRVRDDPGIEVIEHALVVDLLHRRRRQRVCGVTLHVIGEGQVDGVGAAHGRAVVLATGGLGQIYASTTNPSVATGDGMAAALRAGAVLADLEFVQFHPTVLWLGEGSRGQQPLISEAVRGEGAFLVDGAGRAVHAGSAPARRPRARATSWPARSSPGCARPAADHVCLDARHLGAEFLEQRFPSIVARCRELGFDPATELLPVAPAQHYASRRGRDRPARPVARSTVSTRAASARAPACTAPTGSRPTRCSRGWSSRTASPTTSPTRLAAGELPCATPASDAGDAAVLDASHRLDVQRAMTRGVGAGALGRARPRRGPRGARRPRRDAAEHGRARAGQPGRRPTCCTSGRRCRSSRTGARRPVAGTCARTSPTRRRRRTGCGHLTTRPGRPTGRSSVTERPVERTA